jgi:uncharacterized protein YdeI (BOF family)
MAQQNSSKLLVVFVLIALILSIVFAWEAIGLQNPFAQGSQTNTNTGSNGGVQMSQAPLQTTGVIGINIAHQTQTKGAQQ